MTPEEASQQGERIASQFNPTGITPFPFDAIFRAHPNLLIIENKLSDSYLSTIFYLSKPIARPVEDSKSESQVPYEYAIVVDEDLADEIRNFSLAHSLGHYFLHSEEMKVSPEKAFLDRESYFDDSIGIEVGTPLPESRRKLEQEANRFAFSLLMPEETVRRVWETVNKDVDKIASVFNVSVVVMSLRLKRLGLVD